MTKQEKGDDYSSLSARKDRVGNGPLCTGNASGSVPERRSGQLSGLFVEMRKNVGIDYL